MEIEGPYSQYAGFRLFLVAITEQGVVADSLADLPLDDSPDLSPRLSVEVEVLVVEGEVQGEVTWTHTTYGVTEGEEVAVRWGRSSCQSHTTLPHCQLDNPVYLTNDTIDTEVSTL